MIRFFYSIVTYLLTPFVLWYLIERSKGNRAYKYFWGERFGFSYKKSTDKPIIWLHAVSVGEALAMSKIIELIEKEFIDYQILITTMTPTGRDVVKNTYKNCIFYYIPYDMPHAVKRFYKVFKPKVGLIMETEIWPNLLHYSRKFNTKLYLVNARLSKSSYRSYKRINFVFNPFLNNFDAILSQDENTSQRFIDLGYNGKIKSLGSTKFDLEVKSLNSEYIKLSRENILDKKIVIFASTREKEESLILKNMPKNNKYLVIIVPRHPERFKEVEQLVIEHKFSYQLRSNNESIFADTQILIGDSMGEMFTYFSISDIAVIGGSFNNGGGQNIIEPIYVSKPVIFGPSMFNFHKISLDAIEYGCGAKVKNMSLCFDKIKELIENQDIYNNMVIRCKNFVEENSGASKKIMNFIKCDASI